MSIRDRHGWLVHDRFVLRAPVARDDPAWDGLGFAESHPYFASVAIVGAFDGERFGADVGRLDGHGGAAWVGVAALARRGALVRCLAATAPALGDAVEACWRLARRALLGLSPLALRKG